MNPLENLGVFVRQLVARNKKPPQDVFGDQFAKEGDPGGDVPSVDGTLGEQPSQPFILGPRKKPEAPTPPSVGDDNMALALDQFSRANRALAVPPPTMAQPKIDPIESVLAAVAGNGIHNPTALSNVGNIPLLMARDRAANENEFNSGVYKQQSELAQAQAQNALRMGQAILTRDGVSERVEGMLKSATLKAQTAQMAQDAKNDQQFIKLLSTPGITMSSIAAYAQSKGASPEQAQDFAEKVADDLEKNPSFAVQIKRQQVENKRLADEDKAKTDRVKTIMESLRHSKDMTAWDRYNAFKDLRDLGVPAYQIDDSQLLAHAKEETFAQKESVAHVTHMAAQDELAKARAKTGEVRRDVFRSQFKLNEKRAAFVAKETDLLDSETAAKIAVAYATVDNLNDLVGDREIKNQLTLNSDAAKIITDSMKSLHDDLQGLGHEKRARLSSLSKLEGKLAGIPIPQGTDPSTMPDVVDLKDRITNLKDEILQVTKHEEEIRTSRDKLQKQLGDINPPDLTGQRFIPRELGGQGAAPRRSSGRGKQPPPLQGKLKAPTGWEITGPNGR